MPGYIAWVYVYGLSTQLAQAEGTFNRWNEEGYRQEYYERLVAGVDNVVQAVEVEPEPEVTVFDEEDVDTGSDEEEGDAEEEDEPVPAAREVAPMKPEPKAKALRRGKSTSKTA